MSFSQHFRLWNSHELAVSNRPAKNPVLNKQWITIPFSFSTLSQQPNIHVLPSKRARNQDPRPSSGTNLGETKRAPPRSDSPQQPWAWTSWRTNLGGWAVHCRPLASCSWTAKKKKKTEVRFKIEIPDRVDEH